MDPEYWEGQRVDLLDDEDNVLSDDLEQCDCGHYCFNCLGMDFRDFM
jgi:hypothetical protein